MNRKLLALTLAASMAAPAVASAQEFQLPTVYGRLHLSLNHLDNDDDTSTNVSSNSSRLGFKGEHDFGSGLTGIYQVEVGYEADNGANEDKDTFTARNIFAGLRGDFGTVRAGQFDTAVKGISGKVDFFSDQVGDNESLDAIDVFNLRMKNSIAYTTPSLNGFKGELQYSTNTDTGAQEDDEGSVAATVMYDANGLYVGLGYQTLFEGEDKNEPSVIRLGAAYNIGALTLSAFAQQIDSDDEADESKTFGVGAKYSMGKLALKAQYYVDQAELDDADAELFAVGVDYKFAKNLTAYANYSVVTNDDLSGQRPWDAISDDDFETFSGEDNSAFGVGIIYNF